MIMVEAWLNHVTKVNNKVQSCPQGQEFDSVRLIPLSSLWAQVWGWDLGLRFKIWGTGLTSMLMEYV